MNQSSRETDDAQRHGYPGSCPVVGIKVHAQDCWEHHFQTDLSEGEIKSNLAGSRFMGHGTVPSTVVFSLPSQWSYFEISRGIVNVIREFFRKVTSAACGFAVIEQLAMSKC